MGIILCKDLAFKLGDCSFEVKSIIFLRDLGCDFLVLLHIVQRRNVIRCDDVSAGSDYDLFNEVLQLTNIARLGIAF